ncbi:MULTISPECIES: hypothetical protein [unclassified Leifsonia]|uniref:hypothetical protein n=1 Tax=unclassified Leifsonia TaxID=2663824 RepID=UPI0008A7FC3C|nr:MULTISPECIES: hypothetical protein [unclassified Leifsonia]SEH89549.1 hypothetical protein SAMN04515694_10621 [Leifsonia sp. CL154]SFL54782.1 hypothetical protein SAMN04515692_106169 [Leifsonia sp. CL147]
MTVLGGSLLVGGVNSAINHASIATSGQELNLTGMASDAVGKWYDANVVKPAADSGSWALQFLAGVGSGIGDAISGGAQLNVHQIGQGLTSLFTDQSARDRLWNQLTTIAAQVFTLNPAATGQLVGSLLPGTAALKAARAAGPIGRAGELAGALGKPVTIGTAGKATSVLNGIKNHLGEGTPVVSKDFTPTTKIFTSSDPHVAEAAGAIEKAMPGAVKNVNGDVHMMDGLSREVDIDLGSLFVQVKSGNARGLTGQIQKTVGSTGRTTVGYAPDMPTGAWESAARQGIPIARTPDELVAIVKELR